jgi:hypothetical protein
LEYTAHLADGDYINVVGYPYPVTVDTTDHSAKFRAGFKFW